MKPKHLDIARAAWLAMWRGDAAAVWAPDGVSFIPFDRSLILRDRGAILDHWRQRRTEYHHVEDRWTLLNEWTHGDASLLVADVRLDLTSVNRSEVERRSITLSIALTGVEHQHIAHLGEAVPAALVTLLKGYEREARCS